jgi:hypothetical protein
MYEPVEYHAVNTHENVFVVIGCVISSKAGGSNICTSLIQSLFVSIF